MAKALSSTTEALFAPDLLLDVPYIFEESDEDSPSYLLMVDPVKTTPRSYNLYHWDWGWVYDDNISKESVAQRLRDAKKIYLNIQ